MNEHSSKQTQSPATPTYILRGHAAPIHALYLFASNMRLISGDAEGWIVIWDVVSKRPVASWKAHGGAVLEARGFKEETGAATVVYTHGRDHKLRVWRFRVQDEEFLDKTFPVDVKETAASQSCAQSQPWMLHSLPVNALNFCAFDLVFLENAPRVDDKQELQPGLSADASPSSSDGSRSPVLIAVPNALNSGAIDIFHLPLERRVSTIPADTTTNTGMVMAVHLFVTSGELYAASAYEDGHVMLFVLRGRLRQQDIMSTANGHGVPWKWEKLYKTRPHTQPVLSIDVAPSKDYFLSSSADALLVKHPIPTPGLVGHLEESPLKTVNTKHSGQQGLRIRSDGKIFVTAGWDCRTRVYSCKTMKELAVLKWHQDGCYAAAFADVTDSTSNNSPTGDMKSEKQKNKDDEQDVQLTKRTQGDFSLATVQHQRNQKAQRTHWLAVGSKDGKISLWDIY